MKTLICRQLRFYFSITSVTILELPRGLIKLILGYYRFSTFSEFTTSCKVSYYVIFFYYCFLVKHETLLGQLMWTLGRVYWCWVEAVTFFPSRFPFYSLEYSLNNINFLRYLPRTNFNYHTFYTKICTKFNFSTCRYIQNRHHSSVSCWGFEYFIAHFM